MKKSILLVVLLTVFLSMSVFAEGKTEFVICDQNGVKEEKTFTKATITVSGIDQSGNYLYRGADIGIFKTGEKESVYQKRVLTDALNIQIADFGSPDKYNSSSVYIIGYRVLYSLIDTEDGSVIETDWKYINGNYFRLNQEGLINQKLFKDIDDSHWAYTEIKYMVDNGVISGYDDGTFRPNEIVTREQFAKMATLSLGLKESENKDIIFSDVSEKDWAYTYIEAIKPYLDGFKLKDKIYFKGLSKVSREQAISTIVKAKSLSVDQLDIKELSVFKDYKSISSKYSKYILKAYKDGIISGDNGNIKPKEGLTRAEAVMLLYGSVR